MNVAARNRSALGLALSAVVLIATLFAGCGGGGSSGTSSDAPQRGGTLTVAEESEVDTLDPAKGILLPDINILEQIIEGLFRTNEQKEVKPWLIDGYEKSNDLREWTFHLKPDVRFSTGQKMTAADVVFSIDSARNSLIWGGLYEPITSVSATSPTTVVVKTNVPSPALPYLLAIYPTGIVPKDHGGVSAKAFGENPIGTGPFKLVSWKRGQALTLERNPRYWQPQLPYLEKIVYQSAPEDTSRVAQLKAGNLDFIAKPSWAQLSGLEGTPGMAIAKAEDTFVGSIILNARKPLFKDPRAREAVNLALDRTGITEAALKGQGQPAVAWFPLSMRFADTSLEPPAKDVEKAKKLLAEAVAESGEDPAVSFLYTGEAEYGRTSAQVIQADLEAAGFTVSLDPADFATVTGELANGTYDLALGETFSLVPDPVEWFGYYTSTEGLFTGAPIESIEKLITDAAQEVDPERRASLYDRIQQQMVKENYLVNINDYPIVYAHSDEVQGINVNSTGTVRLGEVWLSE